MILLPLLLAAAQSDRLPPANALPPPSDETAVMAPVNALFAALAAHDGAAILAQGRPEGGATVAVERADGSRSVRHLGWAEFAAGIKPGPERLEERLTDPAIEIDGDIALVWSPYEFLVDGKIAHCGVDHFDLVREAGRWRIQNVTWSQRTSGCEG